MSTGYRPLLVNLLVIISMLIFIMVFFRRIDHLSADAERLAEQQFVIMANAALTNTLLQAASQHRLDDLPQLAGSNPMQLLLQIPDVYRGEFSTPDLQQVPPGHWYFDPSQGSLIYRLMQNVDASPPYVEHQYQVQFQYLDQNGDQVFEWDQDLWQGIRLVAQNTH